MGHLRKTWEFLTRPEVYWRLFSLLLACILWLLAAGDGSLGGIERVISLTVEVASLPADLVILEQPDPVKVRIRGLAPILNRSEEGVRAKIDLSTSEQGLGTYGVEVEAPAGVEVVSITPRWVSVQTEEVTSQVFPVTLALLGIEPSKLLVSVAPIPPAVTVVGPNSILRLVDHVVAYVTKELDQWEGGFPVQALDAQGRSLALLKIDPPLIKVRIEQIDPEGEE